MVNYGKTPVRPLTRAPMRGKLG